MACYKDELLVQASDMTRRRSLSLLMAFLLSPTPYSHILSRPNKFCQVVNSREKLNWSLTGIQSDFFLVL